MRRPGRFVNGIGARHLRSGVRATLVKRDVGSICVEPVQVVGLTSEEGLIRGAGPIGLGFPQRGLGETGKSPITTVKHRRVFCGLHSIALHCAIYISCIKLLIHCV